MTTHACRVCHGALEILECEVRKYEETISEMQVNLFLARSQVVLSKVRAKDSRKAVLTAEEAEAKPWLKLGSKPTVETAMAQVAMDELRVSVQADKLQELFEKRRTILADRDNAQIAYLCCSHRYD